MNLLQIFFIISGLIILIIWFDVAKRQKFNALHFLVFIWVGGGLLVFSIFPSILSRLWQFFWIPRGADVLVYMSIIFLVYFVLLLLRKVESNSEDITKLIREIALNNSSYNKIKWKEVFIIPSYNEWEVIWDTIENIIDNWYKNILVINDWSNDNTGSILKKFDDSIVVLNHYKNRWQWASLETWFEFIRRYWEVDYIITFDADWQHDIKDVKTFEKYLKEHKKVQVLLWSRFLWKKQRWIPLSRRIILKLWILFTYFLSNIKLSDAHNGFRVIKSSVLDDIRLTISWMWHASEIVDIIAIKKLIYKEVPVNIKYTEYSLKKGQSSMNAINIALKIIWSKFFR